MDLHPTHRHFHAKAPLRIGLAGGGTDTSPYSDDFGGAALNATVSLYAYATIRPLDEPKIVLTAADRNETEVYEAVAQLPVGSDGLILQRGVYNRVVRDYAQRPFGFELVTYVDAPAGSGMGTSSTLVVAILGAFTEWLGLPLGEYEMAHLAWEIERIDLGMAGGKQDQYAATFGGFNFMEFYKDHVLVNPLRVKSEHVTELEYSLVLYNTGTSRLSSKIIAAQTANVAKREQASLDAMHALKEQATMMKAAILKGELDTIGQILDYGWQHKKRIAKDVSNAAINDLYDRALAAGATGGKISGAGGGGFMFFYCPNSTRYAVRNALAEAGGECVRFIFVEEGVRAWTSK